MIHHYLFAIRGLHTHSLCVDVGRKAAECRNSTVTQQQRPKTGSRVPRERSGKKIQSSSPEAGIGSRSINERRTENVPSQGFLEWAAEKWRELWLLPLIRTYNCSVKSNQHYSRSSKHLCMRIAAEAKIACSVFGGGRAS